MTRQQMCDSIMQVISKCLETDLLHKPLSDLMQVDENEENEVAIGLFWLAHDSNGVAYGITYRDDLLTIFSISDLMVTIVIERRDGNVYSFPKNPLNVSRVKLMDIFKKCEDAYKIRFS